MNQQLQLEQKLELSPQLYQAMKILSMDAIDLENEIAAKLEENPALELEEPLSDFAEDLQLKTSYSSDDNSVENLSASHENLHDHLLEQLHWENLTKKERALGELLIQNLNEKGFHLTSPFLLCKTEDEKKILPKLLKAVQTFEPVGCAVADSIESLCVQIAYDGLYHLLKTEELHELLHLVEHRKYKEVADQLKCTLEEVDDFICYLKGLNFYPGLQYGSSSVNHVYPELRLDIINNECLLSWTDQKKTSLVYNPFYEELASQSKDKEVRDYARKQLKDAELFINSIKLRKVTLLKVAYAIVQYQKDFFIRGRRYLKALTMRQIASELGLHETTVSRAVTGKYLETKEAIVSFKSFFTNAVARHDGSSVSREVIKDAIRDIINASGQNKISDQKISNILDKMGYKVARRTVTKYRGEISSAF